VVKHVCDSPLQNVGSVMYLMVQLEGFPLYVN